MEPDFKALAAQDPGSWHEVCRLFGDVVFWWEGDDYQGRWLGAARIGGEPVVFAGYFGSCSGCDELQGAVGYGESHDLDGVAGVIRNVWDGRKVGADAVVDELERLGNEACGSERQACLDAAKSLGLTITLMEVEP